MKCVDCKFHKVISDPDPDDWFNRDDVAIVCTQASNDEIDMRSKYVSDHSKYKIVSCSLRPYQIDKVSNPVWCPFESVIRNATLNKILDEK